jgi:hypothetical protein
MIKNMVTWDPKEELGPIRYLLFKIGMWVSVDTVPDWVSNAEQEYYQGIRDKYGHRPYDETKVFVGDSLKYCVEFENYYGRKIRTNYQVKIK